MKLLSTLLGIAVLVSPVSLLAQDAPAVQVTAGYSYLTRPNAVLVGVISDQPAGTSDDELVCRNYWNAAIVGQVSATYTTGTLNSRAWHGEDTAYAFLGGGRASLRRRAVVPFGQVLLGLIRTDADITEGTSGRVGQWSDHYFALSAGGGVDIRLGGSIGVHVAADVMRTSRGRQALDYDRTWPLQAGLILPMR
jgi:hypothetical protein